VEEETRHEREGIVIRNLVRPVDRAGCYVPGGRAVYPSTVLMTAIPAQVAGVPEIALCVPPGPDGSVPQATLAAAALLGLEEVYRVGGAQAIAAMAFGTESIKPVDVIVGPGNVYVTLAKREVAGRVGIEATAGPSELVVVADEAAPADYVAIDLMAQAEHGPNGAALLVTWSETLADDVAAAIDRLLAESSRREDTEATLRSGGSIVLVDDERRPGRPGAPRPPRRGRVLRPVRPRRRRRLRGRREPRAAHRPHRPLLLRPAGGQLL
jgi:histidinol dehydrogenase